MSLRLSEKHIDLMHAVKEKDMYARELESTNRAVAYLRHKPVDILLLDMIIDPGMDGLDTYNHILEFIPGQKAVIASGYAENERVRQAQALGADPCIKKPYTIDKLGQAIHREVLRHKNNAD
jgi:two-component system cell cycle sensor histidine kinase/response regulator CckA